MNVSGSGSGGGEGPGPAPSTVEVLVEGIPAAVSLAPSGGGLALGGELPLDAKARPGVESLRAGLLQAGPLAAAGVLANGANVIVTVAVARILSPHSYGALNQLTGLFLILSMPGSAVVVAVVRRVTMWSDSGSEHLVRRWAGRVHRQGTLAVVAWAAIVFATRHWIAVLLGQHSGIGIAAILTAAGFFVLLSLDRGLLQARRGYRPLAGNLLVEGGTRTVFVLALVGAGKGSSGAAVGILLAEMVTAAQARYVAVRAPGRRIRSGHGWPAGSPPCAPTTCWTVRAPNGNGWSWTSWWPRCPSRWWRSCRTSTCWSSGGTIPPTAGRTPPSR